MCNPGYALSSSFPTPLHSLDTTKTNKTLKLLHSITRNITDAGKGGCMFFLAHVRVEEEEEEDTEAQQRR
jgi:hypothetical protein